MYTKPTGLTNDFDQDVADFECWLDTAAGMDFLYELEMRQELDRYGMNSLLGAPDEKHYQWEIGHAS